MTWTVCNKCGKECANDLGGTCSVCFFHECECSEDYGPCEDHCTVYAQREGAAVRTGDELAAVYVGDAVEILTDLGVMSDQDARDVESAYWEAHPSGGWCEETEDSEALTDACRTMEDALGAEGFWTYWNDGYVILKPTADCPLVDTDDGGHAERSYFAAGMEQG